MRCLIYLPRECCKAVNSSLGEFSKLGSLFGPVYTCAVLFGGMKTGPSFRELPIALRPELQTAVPSTYSDEFESKEQYQHEPLLIDKTTHNPCL